LFSNGLFTQTGGECLPAREVLAMLCRQGECEIFYLELVFAAQQMLGIEGCSSIHTTPRIDARPVLVKGQNCFELRVGYISAFCARRPSSTLENILFCLTALHGAGDHLQIKFSYACRAL
jgi:hypothetical protein